MEKRVRVKMKPYKNREALKRYLNTEYVNVFKDSTKHKISQYGRWLYENDNEKFERVYKIWGELGKKIDNILEE